MPVRPKFDAEPIDDLDLDFGDLVPAGDPADDLWQIPGGVGPSIFEWTATEPDDWTWYNPTTWKMWKDPKRGTALARRFGVGTPEDVGEVSLQQRWLNLFKLDPAPIQDRRSQVTEHTGRTRGAGAHKECEVVDRTYVEHCYLLLRRYEWWQTDKSLETYYGIVAHPIGGTVSAGAGALGAAAPGTAISVGSKTLGEYLLLQAAGKSAPEIAEALGGTTAVTGGLIAWGAGWFCVTSALMEKYGLPPGKLTSEGWALRKKLYKPRQLERESEARYTPCPETEATPKRNRRRAQIIAAAVLAALATGLGAYFATGGSSGEKTQLLGRTESVGTEDFGISPGVWVYGITPLRLVDPYSPGPNAEPLKSGQRLVAVFLTVSNQNKRPATTPNIALETLKTSSGRNADYGFPSTPECSADNPLRRDPPPTMPVGGSLTGCLAYVLNAGERPVQFSVGAAHWSLTHP